MPFYEPTGDLYILNIVSSRMLLLYGMLTEAIDALNNACKLYHQKCSIFPIFHIDEKHKRGIDWKSLTVFYPEMASKSIENTQKLGTELG